jgi:hypothetical protein
MSAKDVGGGHCTASRAKSGGKSRHSFSRSFQILPEGFSNCIPVYRSIHNNSLSCVAPTDEINELHKSAARPHVSPYSHMFQTRCQNFVR